MKKKVNGRVTGEVTYSQGESEFEVISDDFQTEIKAKNSGRRAVLDYIFLRPGQEITIEGNMSNDVILVENSMINIKEL